MQPRRLYTLLTYAGALPFVACALLPWVGVEHVGRLGSVYRIAALYGLVIASFVAGSHWGIYLSRRGDAPVNLFVTSNVVAVAVWFVSLLGNFRSTLLALMLAFAYLVLVDFRLQRAGITTTDYWRTRLRVSAIVVASLAVTLVAHVVR